MALNLNEDSEFRDALIKQGIIPKPTSPLRSPSPEYRRIDAKEDTEREQDDDSNDDLDDLDDDDDSIPQHILDAYKHARMSQLSRPRFGSVIPISKADYSREVTDASKTLPDSGFSVPVVCFLWDDSVDESRLVAQYLTRLAAAYPYTKFVSIVGNMCIENYPTKNIPTLLIYRHGDVVRQTIGLSSSQAPEFNKENTTLEAFEKFLQSCGAVEADLKQT